MSGIPPVQLIALHPKLYHMASFGSWPTIERHGLLSTNAPHAVPNRLEIFLWPDEDLAR